MQGLNDPSISQIVRDNREAGEFRLPSELTMSRTRFFWWLGSGAIIAIITATLFWVKVDGLAKTAADKQSVKEVADKQAVVDSRITANTAAVEGFRARFASDDRLHDSQNARLDSFKGELDRREPYLKKVDVMDFMREYGISNKEDYFRRHGIAPPAMDGATPAPAPAPRH